MKSIYQALAELETKNESAALCTVVRSQGSTPRHSTSKMLVYEDGSFIGTVGGGELENRVYEVAKQSLVDGVPQLLEYTMADPARGDPGVCPHGARGRVRVRGMAIHSRLAKRDQSLSGIEACV